MDTQSHYTVTNEDAFDCIATAENSVIGGINQSSTIRLFPSWRYSRQQLVDFIKKSKFALFKYGDLNKKVFWLGPLRTEFQRMLSATVYTTSELEQTISIEQEIYQIRRTSFIDCAYFSPNDLMLFQLREDVERRIEGGFVLNHQYYNWWSTMHLNFVNGNQDCLDLVLSDRPIGLAFTIRELLYHYLLLNTDYLVNA